MASFCNFIRKIMGLDSENNDVNEEPTEQMKPNNFIEYIMVKPSKFDECLKIADSIKEGKTVIMNLEDTGKELSRRILDFLSGVAYSKEGQIKKVSHATFIVLQPNADFAGISFEEFI